MTNLLQHFVHAGQPHEGGPACAGVQPGDPSVHCWACGRDGPRKFAVVCGECFHGWRWRWLLSLHDARVYWRMRSPAGPWDDAPPWPYRIRIRRPGKIQVCPCCTHDL